MKTWIYNYQVASIQKNLDKLNKKADKLGIEPLTISETGNYKIKMRKAYRDNYGGFVGEAQFLKSFDKDSFEKIDVPTGLVEVEVKGELPVIDGHVVVAEISHTRTEEGDYENIITPYAFGNEDQELISNMVFNTYKNHAPDCEHCGMNRKRNTTYAVLEQDTMNVSQIASKCLEDYVPNMTLSTALFGSESTKFVNDIGMDSDYMGGMSPSDWFFDTKVAVALSAYATRNLGFKSAKEMDSTKALVQQVYSDPRNVPGEMRQIVNDHREGVENKWLDDAEKIIQFINDQSPDNQYYHNLKVALKSEVVQSKGARWGLVNSAANAYYKAEFESKNEFADEFFMEEKARGMVKFKVVKVKESGWDDAYPNNFLTMITDSGHKIHFKQYFPSSLDALEIDKTYIAKGTVKEQKLNNNGEKVSYLARLADLEEVSVDTPEPEFKPAKKPRKKKVKEAGIEM